MFFKKLKLELKTNKDSIIIPIIIMSLIVILSHLLYLFTKDIEYIYNLLQFIVPIFSVFTIVNSLSLFIEKTGSEVLRIHSNSNLKCILSCVLKYGTIYIFATNIIMFILLNTLGCSDFNILLTLLSQEIFYISLNYLLMIVVGESSWCIFITFSYFTYQFLTKGDVLPCSNIYDFYYISTFKIHLVQYNFLLSLLLLFLGSLLVIKNKINILNH